MAYKVTETCISCGACAGECPVSCITSGDTTYVIETDQCISCGACAGICPVEAIEEE
ncbi:MAG: 4Fe-4S binding protein [Oscillospiraceae bacterium]|nr:4Fe-4S binding protein [Oscillospiraceae bacterium]